MAGPGPRRARRARRRATSRAPTPRSTRTRAEDEEGLRRFFKEFSFPGGIGSHCTPETPGSIHEGGELGYVLSHACGAAFDNPDLIVAAVVGDGEAETGPLATSLALNKFLNPIRDGAVLPILHLNGYKINNPTLLGPHLARGAREPSSAATAGRRYFVEGSDPEIDAPGDGRDARPLRRRRSAAPRQRRARTGDADPPALADDRAAHAQGLDRPDGSGRPQARRLLAGAPGAAGRREEGPGAAEAARGLAAQLQARGAVRRRRGGSIARSCKARAPRARGAWARTRTPTAGS